MERWWIVVRCAGGAHLLRQKSDAMDRVPPAFLAYYISTLLHGHFYDGEGAVATGVVAGEGAPLLRPLARLTSFGGYVATGVVAGEGAPLLRPLARLTSFGGYVATANYISTLLHG